MAVLMAVPPIKAATFCANSLACGMKVGSSFPWLASVLPEGPEPDDGAGRMSYDLESLVRRKITVSRASGRVQKARGADRWRGVEPGESGKPEQDSGRPARPPVAGVGQQARRVGTLRRDDGWPRYGCIRQVHAGTVATPWRDLRGCPGAYADQRLRIRAHPIAELIVERGREPVLLRQKQPANAVGARAEAAKATPLQVKRCGCFASQAVDFSVRTS